MIRESRAHWAAAGCVAAKLITDYRHFDLNYSTTPDYEAMKALWRANFNRFAAPGQLAGVDLVEEFNEYTDSGMITDPARLLPAITSARAAAAVWNKEYRGKVAPSDCRLVLCNSPVGNDVPREYFELAVAEDCVLGVHPYTHWEHGWRDPGDWRFHSGRWNFQELEYGIKPRYVFTECGPYFDAQKGWRHPDCLGGDVGRMVEAMRAWYRDVAQTAAYREGRILGQGAWFTSGSGGNWPFYEMGTAELLQLAGMAREEWKPGAPVVDVEDEMDETKKAAIIGHLDAIRGLLEPKHDLRTLTNQQVINLFNKATGGLGVLQRIGLLSGLVSKRDALYTGPAVEDLPLTDSEKSAVILAL